MSLVVIPLRMRGQLQYILLLYFFGNNLKLLHSYICQLKFVNNENTDSAKNECIVERQIHQPMI